MERYLSLRQTVLVTSKKKNCVNSGLSITILPKISSIIQIRTVGADNYLNDQNRALPVTIEHGLP